MIVFDLYKFKSFRNIFVVVTIGLFRRSCGGDRTMPDDQLLKLELDQLTPIRLVILRTIFLWST